MPGKINLRLEGHDEVLNPNTYINALRHFWGMLRDLDLAISKGRTGSIHWEIESISKNSPAVVTFRGRSLTAPDSLDRVERSCIVGLKQLSQGQRLPDYSDAAVKKALQLASLHSHRKPGGLNLIQVSTDSNEVDVGPHTVDGIQSLIKVKYESLGSIVGNLDSISVHRGNEFRVWEELEGRPVTCRFPDILLERAKEALGSRVLVHGDIKSNFRGQRTLVMVHGFEPYPQNSELHTIEQMSGIIDDLTDGMPLGEYIEDIRRGGGEPNHSHVRVELAKKD